MQTNSTTHRTPQPKQIATGDLVRVFDDISAKDEWYQAADVVEKDNRTRVRLVGFNFYVSASLIKEVRHA